MCIRDRVGACGLGAVDDEFEGVCGKAVFLHIRAKRTHVIGDESDSGDPVAGHGFHDAAGIGGIPDDRGSACREDGEYGHAGGVEEGQHEHCLLYTSRCV